MYKRTAESISHRILSPFEPCPRAVEPETHHPREDSVCADPRGEDEDEDRLFKLELKSACNGRVGSRGLLTLSMVPASPFAASLLVYLRLIIERYRYCEETANH